MLALTIGSLRHRPGSYAASFVTLFLGATIVMTFGSLLDTRTPGLPAESASALFIMPTVVGGWGLIIVTFAAASTLSLTVRQRQEDMALLKSVGATPAQIGRLVVGEAAAVAVVAAALAIPAAIGTGDWLLSLLTDTGQVAAGVPHRFGPFAIGIGMGVTLLAAVLAAALATWRTTRARTGDALLASQIEQPGLGRARILAGVVLLLGASTCAVLTATVLDATAPESMAIAAEGAILTSIGLALLAPLLLRGVLAVVGAPLRAISGVSGYLTVVNLRRRAKEMGAALVPIILFTGIATGTLYMQAIENATVAGQEHPVADTIQTLNLVVVGMIAVFTAVLVVTTLVATTAHRRREFGQQRLAGSTPPQVLRMVGMESAVLTATAVLFGSLAAVVTIVPYSLLKTGHTLPDTTITVYLGVVALAVLLTFAASRGSATRAIRTPAVHAVRAIS